MRFCADAAPGRVAGDCTWLGGTESGSDPDGIVFGSTVAPSGHSARRRNAAPIFLPMLAVVGVSPVRVLLVLDSA
jgi:hypothetical protein